MLGWGTTCRESLNEEMKDLLGDGSGETLGIPAGAWMLPWWWARARNPDRHTHGLFAPPLDPAACSCRVATQPQVTMQTRGGWSYGRNRTRAPRQGCMHLRAFCAEDDGS